MEMEGISDLKIVGLDPLRPPRIQNIPCIDLYFELAHAAPEEWCHQFNKLVGKPKYTIKLDPQAGQFIETWVRKPAEIEVLLTKLKDLVARCSKEYIAIEEAKRRQPVSEKGTPTESPAQLALNEITAALNFDD